MNHKAQLENIEKLMQRSTRFLSLSGLSGVAAGVIALIGAYIANSMVEPLISGSSLYSRPGVFKIEFSDYLLVKLAVLAGSVLFLSVIIAFYFCSKRARKMGVSLFDQSAIHLLKAFFPAMMIGAFFCLVFLVKGYYSLIVPSTLLFYGLALLNASKFTLNEVFYLGVSEIILGAVCVFLPGYSYVIWSFGFGVLHILYGTVMYFKYEKDSA